jgi:hypothetical protein
MPNWCDNCATISNQDKTKIDELEKVLADKDNQQIFQHLRPRPESEEENWYDWNINNWGTKWDITPHHWEREDDNTITLNFDSAWSPPTTLYEYLEETGWEITAYYHEGGMGFCGRFVNGQDECYDYDMSDRSSIEEIPEDIENYAGLLDYHDECKANGDFDEAEVG